MALGSDKWARYFIEVLTEHHNLELLKEMKKCVSSLEASGAIGPGDTTTNALMEALRIRIAELELYCAVN